MAVKIWMKRELNQSRVWPWSSTICREPTASTRSTSPVQSVLRYLTSVFGKWPMASRSAKMPIGTLM